MLRRALLAVPDCPLDAAGIAAFAAAEGAHRGPFARAAGLRAE